VLLNATTQSYLPLIISQKWKTKALIHNDTTYRHQVPINISKVLIRFFLRHCANCQTLKCANKTYYKLMSNFSKQHIYVWRKVVFFVLFCLYLRDPLNRDASDHVLGLFGKLLRRRGALAWFHGTWTWDAKVFEYWMIFSLKIKLNNSWTFQRNCDVPLVLLERSWWARFNGIHLVRFEFKMWEMLIFKSFLPLKIQINFLKTGFGRKNQLRTW
jgi:hypothetical protein